MDRRSFLKLGGKGLFLIACTGLSVRSDDLKGYTVNYDKPQTLMQEAYDKVNDENRRGRKFNEFTIGWDTITASLADLVADNNKDTVLLEAYRFSLQMNEARANSKTGKMFIPVIGFDRKKEYKGFSTPTNNPLDWLIAGRNQVLNRKLDFSDKQEIVDYVEEGVNSMLDETGSRNDSYGYIEIEVSESQKNKPYEVSRFVIPQLIDSGKIKLWMTIRPFEYDLKAQKVTKDMTYKT